MTLQVRFHDLAEHEFQEAIRFYLAVSVELADSFVSDVERSALSLIQHPNLGKLIGTEVRGLRVANFPYSLYYRVSTEHVEILAVAHQRRRPLYWKSRA